ncbi:hypothetical protein DSOL_3386 [Desulfosporosinus metallidurans]|uniref:Uncharacterized protein n=1 Tax=Desulfosporosinus metallidurans TaxID=1888891 RepID=A0A1Q8QQQ2_9FIRM|nr:hypothetical protein DSOL_3386 [Desulfosporosinus metallidurans]
MEEVYEGEQLSALGYSSEPLDYNNFSLMDIIFEHTLCLKEDE